MADSSKSILEKIVLAGVGAVSATTEKAKEIVGGFIAKGESTVEQGKAMREEFKQAVQSCMDEHTYQPPGEGALTFLLESVDMLREDELALLKERIEKVEKSRTCSGACGHGEHCCKNRMDEDGTNG